jgi:hypothetical protein
VLRDTGKRDLYLDPVAYTTQQPWGSSADPDITDPDKSRNWPGKGRTTSSVSARSDKNPSSPASTSTRWKAGASCSITTASTGASANSRSPSTRDEESRAAQLLGHRLVGEEDERRAARRGTPLMGNDAFFRRWQLAAWVDVPGREYTWTDDAGKLNPSRTSATSSSARCPAEGRTSC